VRRLSTGAFAVLVAATIAAFFVTQHLKVTTPLIQGSPRPVPGVIDPLHGVGCGKFNSGSTTISFYLQHRSDDVDVYVVDANDEIVRTVATGRHMRKNVRKPDGVFHWDGRLSDGRVAPDGTYHFRVALLNQGRTIDLTGVPVKVKTVPPNPVITRVTPSLIPGPDGTRVTIQYAGNENRGGTVLLYRTGLPGAPRLVKQFLTPWKGHTAVWDGSIRGRPAPAGTYLVGLEVSDAACDTGRFPARIPPAPGSGAPDGVTVSYLSARAPLTPVAAGSVAVAGVRSPGLAYRWSLSRIGAGRPAASGVSAAQQLRVRVPRGGSGLYELTLRSPAGRAVAPIVMDGARRERILVVVPTLTWQGLNPVDDTGDGLPDTLEDSRGPIDLARPLVRWPPAGFGDVAGLLGYLDASRRSYDLATDVGLTSGAGGRLSGHAAVVLAGSERWLPDPLRAALRAYVMAGGRVLSLGIDSLRRGVTVAGERALDPTAPSDVDSLGARVGALVGSSGAPFTVRRDGLGLFSGSAAVLPGFRSYQPVTPVTPPASILSEAGSGSTVAVVAYRLGRGLVIDLGVPGLGSRLRSDAGARSLMGRVWALLSAP
jgi:hypothetical protein